MRETVDASHIIDSVVYFINICLVMPRDNTPEPHIIPSDTAHGLGRQDLESLSNSLLCLGCFIGRAITASYLLINKIIT